MDSVVCQICGFESANNLQSHLWHKHTKLTPTQYMDAFPGFLWYSQSWKNKMDVIRKNNANTPKSLSARSKTGKNNLGKMRSEDWKKTRSEKYSGEGNPFYNKNHSLETKIKLSCHFRNILEEDFDDFSKPLSRREVGSGSFKIWRNKVFERDDYTCLMCGNRGGDLEPHHILPRRDHKDLIYEVENGATLCVECHKKTFKREYQFVELLKEKVEVKNK